MKQSQKRASQFQATILMVVDNNFEKIQEDGISKTGLRNQLGRR